MHRELGGTMSALQWMVNAYTIVFASLVLTCGAMGDRYGARRLYQFGLTLFTAMSLACALSPSVAFLIVFRMAQGLGAADDAACLARPAEPAVPGPACARTGRVVLGLDREPRLCGGPGPWRRIHGRLRMAEHLSPQRADGIVALLMVHAVHRGG